MKMSCVDPVNEGPAEERLSRAPQWHPAHLEGSDGDALLPWPGQGEAEDTTSELTPSGFKITAKLSLCPSGAVRHRDLRHGGEHARQDRRVRQHQETRRHRLQESPARFRPLLPSPPFRSLTVFALTTKRTETPTSLFNVSDR